MSELMGIRRELIRSEDEDSETPSVNRIDGVLKGLKDRAALGIDCGIPMELKLLHLSVKANLAEPLASCNKNVAIPARVYIALIILLTKEADVARPTSLLTTLYRLWTGILSRIGRPSVQDFGMMRFVAR